MYPAALLLLSFCCVAHLYFLHSMQLLHLTGINPLENAANMFKIYFGSPNG